MRHKADIIIKNITPSVGIPDGDVTLHCEGLMPLKLEEDSLHFCGSTSMIEGASTHKLVAHIPHIPTSNEVFIMQDGRKSNTYHFAIPKCIANILHNVGNPAVSNHNDVFATFSGTKGQITPASVFRITNNSDKLPIISGLMNATSLLVGKDDYLYISSRYNGSIYRSDFNGSYEVFSQGMGEAFGMAMDSNGHLYVGDRTGSIFKVNHSGNAEFFTALPSSVVGYHLAIDSKDRLYVTVPLDIGENIIYRISPSGDVEEFVKDLSEYNGIAVNSEDTVFVVESNRGYGSVLKIDPETGEKTRSISGEKIVGLCFNKSDDLYIATFSELFFVKKEEYTKD
ncbi:MAG: SMP-30/gluconolactonase/LRE family protein [Spirochaetes bacterium]|nr:SMP-30/gluconolactonase/LRE family protein [Spirochaetota bacterium]MCK5266767.1 SMP-30/gluconolactonase/LRE family protein [Spirochaetota bacterium]